jgi:FkbM family methyltransferase
MLYKRLKWFFNSSDVRQNPLKALSKRIAWRIRWSISKQPFVIPLRKTLKISIPKSGSGASIYYRGCSEPETADFIERFLRPGMVMIDVGAHIGEYTLQAAQIVGASGCIHAFEPQAHIFPILSDNVRMNDLTNVTLNCAAVCDVVGELEFEVSPEPSMSSIRKHETLTLQTKLVKVPSVSLNSYWAEHKQQIDLIKVDVEGAEKFVFAGASELMSRPGADAPTWIFEYAPRAYADFNYEPIEIVELVQSYGYSIWQYDYGGQVTPFELHAERPDIVNLIATKDIDLLRSRLQGVGEASEHEQVTAAVTPPVSSRSPSNPPLRVLFVSHTYVVGVNQGKLHEIANTGAVEVGLLAPSNWKAPEWNRLLPIEQPFPNLHIYPAPVWFSGRGGAHLYAPWRIWQVLQDFRPDIIQVEAEVFSLCTFELAIWARLLNKPLVVFGWENMERQLPWLRRQICQFVLDTASAIIPGNEDGAKIIRQWGYSGLLEVMPQMGVDTQFFTKDLRPSDPPERLNIGFLGRLVPEKGIELLLSSLQQLKARGLECQLTICGSGPNEAALRQQAQTQQIEDAIEWRGAIRHEQAPIELSKFDVLVLPSRTIATWKEQFGHVLIEAMAMGIPVVGSTCGEIPHAIGRADLIFTEGDAGGLTDILARMIGDPAWRAETGRYGFDRVGQQYSHAQIAHRSIGLWQSVLNQVRQE